MAYFNVPTWCFTVRKKDGKFIRHINVLASTKTRALSNANRELLSEGHKDFVLTFEQKINL